MSPSETIHHHPVIIPMDTTPQREEESPMASSLRERIFSSPLKSIAALPRLFMGGCKKIYQRIQALFMKIFGPKVALSPFEDLFIEKNGLSRLFDFRSNYGSGSNIRLKHSDLTERPLHVLYRFTNTIERYRPRSLYVRFQDGRGSSMAGVDCGGPRRELIAGMFEALPQATEGRLEPLSNGCFHPKAKGNEGLSKSERGFFERIGYLLNFCLAQAGRRDELLIGKVFDEPFYETLLQFNEEELSQGYSLDFDRDFDRFLSLYRTLFQENRGEIECIDRFEKVLRPSSEIPEEKLMELLYTAYPDEDFPEGIDPTNPTTIREKIESLQETIREKRRKLFLPKLQCYLTPIHAIGQGIHRVSDSYQGWSDIQRIGGVDFCTKLQGTLTKDQLLQAMGLNLRGLTGNKPFLREWILAADEMALKNLVRAITGSTSLGVGENRTIISVSNSFLEMAEFHTCFRSLDLPTREFADLRAFTEMLNASIECALEEGFGLR